MGKKHRRFRPLKWLLQQPWMQSALVAMAAGYIKLIYRTCRWDWHIPEATKALLGSGKPVIYAFWHGRLLMMPYTWMQARRQYAPKDGKKMHVLISEHRDGLFISHVCRYFGIQTIHGSSSRGALTGVRECLRTLKQGEAVTFTPDGPRGPCQEVAPGVIAVAQKTGAMIIPWSFVTSRGKKLGSWDRFWLAMPFGRGAYVAGEPFDATRMPSEEAAEALKQALDQCNATAEAVVKR